MRYVQNIIIISFLVVISFSDICSSQINYQELIVKMNYVDSLILSKRDYVAALTLSQEIYNTKDLEIDCKHRLSNIINLIKYYSDYDNKPLELYFKAEQLTVYKNKCGADSLRKKANLQIESIYKQILDEYPDCNLAGFVAYLLANQFEHQYATRNISAPIEDYLANIDKQEKALAYYGRITTNYKNSKAPIHSIFGLYSDNFKINITLAPLAHMKMANLYLSEGKYDLAEKEYMRVITNYPMACDAEGNKLILSSHIYLMQLYSDAKSRNTRKLREVCHDLINNYKNQRFEIMGRSGEIHPEAYLYLANTEENINNTLERYLYIINNYKKSHFGKPHSCDIGAYALCAIRDAVDTLRKEDINSIKNVLNKSQSKTKSIIAQLAIAKYYHYHGQHELSLKKYGNLKSKYGSLYLCDEISESGTTKIYLGNIIESEINQVNKYLRNKK